jgi:AraC family transcriptional regulator
MLVLRQMPDPRRLEPLPRNEAFRRTFYSRWGVENCIVLGSARRVEYPLFEQRLSIKMASGGRERYLLTRPGREVDVDEDHYLVINDGRSYASRIAAEREIESYSIFFRPGFANEVESSLRTPVERALEGGTQTASEPEFQEFLQPHDGHITPVLKFIRHHVRSGLDDPQWYEEQLFFLLARLLEHRERLQRRVARLPACRRTTQAEIYRRVMLAANYIHSHFDRDVDLDELSAQACLSKFHFLRLFHRVMGMTPYAFVLAKRVRAAKKLMATTELTLEEISQQVGFATRSGLYRQLRLQASCRNRSR